MPDRDLHPGTAPRSLAVISNPCAGRNQRALAGVTALLRRRPGVRHYLATTPDELAGVVQDLRAAPPEVLAINAGDGSIALLLGLLLEAPPEPFPLLALVAGGTTNMNAADIGLRGRPAPALARLLAWCERPRPEALRERPILRLQADAAPPHYGLFMGIGLIAQGVARSGELRAAARWPALVPPVLTIGMLLALLRRNHGLAAPLALEIDVDGRRCPAAAVQTLFATTLDALMLGLRPFGGGAPAEYLHWGGIEPMLTAPWRTLPAFLRGRTHPDVTPENGYHRGTARELMLHYSGRYMVDGELYALRSRLQVRATQALRFVRI